MVKNTASELNIFMNGHKVGCLSKQSGGNLAFTYEKSWLAMPQAMPISLSLPLLTKKYEGDMVYNFFDNLLPDNENIRKRIQLLFHATSTQPFELLSSIGHDCVGAIQFSTENNIENLNKITAEPLTHEQIATLLRDYKQAPLGMRTESEDFRISIAGAQEKTALLWHNQQWCKPLGATPTSHIFKLPIGFIKHQNMDLTDSCENEWLCYKIAEAFGLPIASAEICNFNDVKALVVKRFDRQLAEDKSWFRRLVQEDLCQALGYSPVIKYQSDGGPGIKEIMSFLLGSLQANVDREIFFQSQVLFYLLAAIDGHAKNFSIFITAGGRYHLTPLYDIMSAYPLIKKNQLQQQKIKMAMALTGANNHYHWYTIQYRDFLSTAKAVQYSEDEAKRILDHMLEKVDSVIEKVTTQLPTDFPPVIAESIFKGLLSCRDRIIPIK